jgi:hypothetical protein
MNRANIDRFVDKVYPMFVEDAKDYEKQLEVT